MLRISVFLLSIVLSSQASALTFKSGESVNFKKDIPNFTDKFDRTISGYIVPDKWTNITSPLNNLDIPENWHFIPSERYQFLASQNREFRLTGNANNPTIWHCQNVLVERPYDFMGGQDVQGVSPKEAKYSDCLRDLRTRAYEGDVNYVLNILEGWARIGLKQPMIEEPDYDWFLTINFASSLYALYQDELTFSENFKEWLDNSLKNTLLVSHEVENNTFHPRGFITEDVGRIKRRHIYANDCSTTRWHYTQAYLTAGLALNNKAIFDEGIDSLHYILSMFDEANVYPCFAMRGIRAMGYYHHVIGFLSSYELILRSLGYDLFTHEMPNGNKVSEAIKVAFKYLWADDVGPILNYASVNLGTPENKNWQDLKLPLSQRNSQYLPRRPQTMVRNAIAYVERFDPSLKEVFGYEEQFSKKVMGTLKLNVYGDQRYYELFLDHPYDLHALHRSYEEKNEFQRPSSLLLSWYIQMIGDEKAVLEAEDFYFIEKSGDSEASSLKVIGSEFNHLTGAAENHGRENLNLTINDDMIFTLKGKIEVFEGEFAQIGLQSALGSGQRTFFFGPGDSLILKWEHMVE